jgi:uncharacterized membrane protein (UPF0127 family)
MTLNFKKNWQIYAMGAILLCAFVLKMQTYYWPKSEIQINTRVFKVIVANNQKHWQKGLGGRESLGKYDGMFFVFPEVKQHVFIMRDMKFPIDIIWIKNGEIIDIAPNVPVEAAKNGVYTQYYARDDSNAVLELNAGTALKYGLKIGDSVKY